MRRRGARSQAGMTLVETAVTLTIFALSALGVLGVMSYSARLNEVNRETAEATQAARSVIERMRGLPVRDVIRQFNADDSDDLGVAGSAPGDTFTVPNLGTRGGGNGTVILPLTSGELREDATIPAMGFPRDLNGDNTTDALDHKDDFILLPITVRVDWTGTDGDRTLEFHTLLRPWQE